MIMDRITCKEDIDRRIKEIWNKPYMKELPSWVSRRRYLYADPIKADLLITGINPSFRPNDNENRPDECRHGSAKDNFFLAKYDNYWGPLSKMIDEELLTDPFFERFSVIQYVFADGNHLQEHDPAKLFGMKWISECTVEDNLQRMFVAQGFSQDTMIERVMLCTYPLGIVSRAVFCSNKLLLNWFLRDAVLIF